MSTHVRGSLFFLILCAFATISHAQNLVSVEQVPQRREALLLVNSTIIVNGTLTQIDAHFIKKNTVYKRDDIPALYQGLAPTGILDMHYTKKVDSKSLAEIASQLGVSGSLSFVINGHELTATQVATLRLTQGAIGRIHVAKPTSELLRTTVSIELAEDRFEADRYPPGTIFIR